MTDVVDDWIAEVRAKAEGRTRYEGKPPYGDEAAADEIERLRADVAWLREALEVLADDYVSFARFERGDLEPENFDAIKTARAALEKTSND